MVIEFTESIVIPRPHAHIGVRVFGPGGAAWLWNQRCHVMFSLNITVRDKLEVWPSASAHAGIEDRSGTDDGSAPEATLGAEFDLSSLQTSLIRVGRSGTGHHWPR